MDNNIKEYITRCGMLKSGDSVVVGLSGGADSCALLLVLLSLRDEFSLNIQACHINHNLRGEESDGDEAFVRSLCERLGVPLRVFSIDVKGAARKHESTEETARKLRYECFGEMCLGGAKLATAHTASDNAETVLMNLIRGTGTKGLGGIPPVRGKIIRPLLCLTRGDTERICRENGVDFVTDSSNISDDYTRNRIRHNVIPLLEEFNPSFTAASARMTEAVGSDIDFLEKCADEQKALCFDGSTYDSRKLSEMHEAIRFRIIAGALRDMNIEPSMLRVRQCEEIIARGYGKVNLCRDRFALVRKKRFFIIEEKQNYRKNIS